MNAIQTIEEHGLEITVGSAYPYPDLIALKIFYRSAFLIVQTHYQTVYTSFTLHRDIGIREFKDSESGNITVLQSAEIQLNSSL